MADPKKEPAVAEPGKNCPACKKILKRKKRYYRNGAYYCNVNCFKKVQKEKVAAAPQPAAA